MTGQPDWCPSAHHRPLLILFNTGRRRPNRVLSHVCQAIESSRSHSAKSTLLACDLHVCKLDMPVAYRFYLFSTFSGNCLSVPRHVRGVFATHGDFAQRWPDCKPYGSKTDPHLTVADHVDGPTLRAVAEVLRRQLPMKWCLKSTDSKLCAPIPIQRFGLIFFLAGF